MNVVALVDDIQQRIQAAKLLVIGSHVHSLRRHAVTRQSLQVVAVRHSPDPLVMGWAAVGAGNLFPANTLRIESRPTLAASDLRSLAPMRWDRPDCRP
jgi:hypothetical protein